MDVLAIIGTVLATLLAAAIGGLVNLYGQVKTLIAVVEGHEQLNESRHISLAERIDQLRLVVSPPPLPGKRKTHKAEQGEYG